MAIKGTAREMESAPKALASACAIRPTQLIVGLDSDAPAALETLVRDHAPCNLKVMRVQRDDAWLAHFPHVTWEMIRASDNDLILCTDADLILQCSIPEHAGLPGTSNIAAVTFLIVPGSPGLAGAWRRLTFRARRKFGTRKAETGLYFIWRPFYLDFIREDVMRSLRNGVDSIIWRTLEKTDRYDYVSSGIIGAIGCDDHSGDYPSSQFADGINMAAKSSAVRAIARCAYHTILFAHPWYVYGCIWALTHPRHPIVRRCAKAGPYEFTRDVMPQIYGLRKWPASVQERTGFA